LIQVKEAIIVEGKYDKIKLSSLIDGLIIETRGFQIFKDREQMQLIRRLADKRGILVLTDSDSAGFLIRNYLSGSIPPEKIKHAYIPDILGKEKRKEKPSKEGKLGVEGVPAAAILAALQRAGVVCSEESVPAGRVITKADLYDAGLSGGENSAEKRARLLKKLNLPERLTPNALLAVLNSIMSLEEFQAFLDNL
jgi:ribonuclease M5